MNTNTLRASAAGLVAIAATPALAQIGLITPESTSLEALPGSELRVLWLVSDVDAGLFGYSLDIDAQPSDSIGAITIDAVQTNFFESRNLIVAGGGMLDPVFSTITDDGAGGVVINANTPDLSTVVPMDGVNDVLAEVVFTIPDDALGEFVFSLGASSVLADAAGGAVPFESSDLLISVVPTPGVGVFALVGCSMVCRRRRS